MLKEASIPAIWKRRNPVVIERQALCQHGYTRPYDWLMRVENFEHSWWVESIAGESAPVFRGAKAFGRWIIQDPFDCAGSICRDHFLAVFRIWFDHEKAANQDRLAAGEHA